MTEQYRQPSINLATTATVSGNITSFVFRPGGTAVENVFTDWAALVAAAALVAGPKMVTFDDSIVSPCVIPAGTYTLTETSFHGIIRGFPGTISVALSLADGVTLTGVRSISDFLFVTANNTVDPVISSPVNSRAIFVVSNGASISNTGAAPFFHHSQGNAGVGEALEVLLDNSAIVSGGGDVFWTQDNLGVMRIFLSGPQSTVESNTLGTNGGDADVFTNASGTVGGAQVNVAGSYNINFVDDAVQMAYTAAAVGNWSGTNPTSIQNALDRIAAAIGPIA